MLDSVKNFFCQICRFQLGRQKAAKDAEKEVQKLQQELYATKGVRMSPFSEWSAAFATTTACAIAHYPN